MALNKSKGNMYPWVSHTWNPIRGRCPHQCTYCFMKRFPVGELRLVKKALRDDLSKAETIFVGSSTDMWAELVPSVWIAAVLARCREFPETTFLFQSKNPARFRGFAFPPKVIFGTTLESNRDYGPALSLAPEPWDRASAMSRVSGRKMVSVEPILDFDLEPFVAWLWLIQPEFVSVGADSKGHGLAEPSGDKIHALITALEEFAEVKQKSNLKRLLDGR